MSKKLFMSFGGKGGISKSYTAARLSEALIRKFGRKKNLLIDIDPVVPSFSSIKSLGATYLKITEEENEHKIDQLKFDDLIQMIVDSKEDFIFVDTGSNIFLPLLHYIFENEIISILKDEGIEIYIILPIAGGSMFDDCIDSLITTASMIEEQGRIIAVTNEHFGKAISKNNETVHQIIVSDPILAGIDICTVQIPIRSADTFGKQIEAFTTSKITVDEALVQSKKIIEKSRLNQIMKDFDEILETILMEE
jgi:hypothetical protein